MDCVKGHFKGHNSIDSIGSKDPLINAIMELNEIKKKTASKSLSKSMTMLDNININYSAQEFRKNAFGDSNMWTDNTADSSSEDSNNASYSGVEFKVSLVKLVNKLHSDPEIVSRGLYDFQKIGLINYSMSESKVFLTLDISETIHRILVKNESSFDFELYKSSPSLCMKKLYFSWINKISLDVKKRLDGIVDDSSTRVDDMWRIGNMINLVHEVGDKADKASLPPWLSIQDRQKTLMDFISNYYIKHLAPMKNRDETHQLIATDSNMDSMKEVFMNISSPIIKTGQLQSAMIQKEILRFKQDLIQLISNPSMNELVKSVVFSRQNDNIYLHDVNSSDIDYALKSVTAHFAARIFHGLASDRIQSSEWMAAGYWNRHRDIDFMFIVNEAVNILSQ
jgi:hypothetical protein